MMDELNSYFDSHDEHWKTDQRVQELRAKYRVAEDALRSLDDLDDYTGDLYQAIVHLRQSFMWAYEALYNQNRFKSNEST